MAVELVTDQSNVRWKVGAGEAVHTENCLLPTVRSARLRACLRHEPRQPLTTGARSDDLMRHSRSAHARQHIA